MFSLIFSLGVLAESFLKLEANSICIAIATIGFSTVEIHVLLSAIWFIVFSVLLIISYIILIVKSSWSPFLSLSA